MVEHLLYINIRIADRIKQNLYTYIIYTSRWKHTIYNNISNADRRKQVLYIYIRSVADEKEGCGRSELLPDDKKIGRMKWKLYKSDWKDGRGHTFD